MQRRILSYAERRTAAAELPGGAALVLREVFCAAKFLAARRRA